MIHKKIPIRKDELECTNCKLHETCRFTNKMETWGSQNPTWLFVVDAPGETEDAEGIPFVGEHGNVFRDILREIGFANEDIAIASSNVFIRKPDFT